MKQSIFSIALILGVALYPATVLAQTQTISEDQALNASSTIALKVGQGTNIKLPQGVLVYKGWIDDGNIAQVDGDRPFAQGASILHLVASRPGQTQMSLLTRDDNGVESLYVFKVVAGSKGASIVNVTGSAIASSSIRNVASSSNQGVEIFERGLDVALSQGLVVPNSTFHRAIQTFISKVGQGLPVARAAQKAGLSEATAENLFNLGNSLPRSVPASETTLVKATTETLPRPEISHSEPRPEISRPEFVQVPDTAKDYTRQLETRVAQLEQEVKGLNSKVSSLDSQQEHFLARLDNLDSQQEIFTAKLRDLNVAQKANLKIRPITLTLEPFKLSKVSQKNPQHQEEPLDIKNQSKSIVQATTPLSVGGPTLNNHEIANAISTSLLTHPDTPYGNWLNLRYQSMIRRLRRGVDPTRAANASRVTVEHFRSVLRNVGVEPEDAGLSGGAQ